MNRGNYLTDKNKSDLIDFAQNLVRIKSYSSQEEQVINLVKQKMLSLGFDEVRTDNMGNVLGRIGNGTKTIMFDSHVDTVEVNDEDKWAIPPFSGQIMNERLQGRGSVDMKSSVAASIFAGALASKKGLLDGKTVFVSCTVNEEDCDGENLKHLFQEFDIRPDYMIICEPSNNNITLGHNGKAQIIIKSMGISAHGAEPEKGVNAIYEMAEIIQKVENLNKSLPTINGKKGTLVLSQISSVSASLNAVPSQCEIYLDRRIVPGETEADIRQEMDELTRGKNAIWEIGTLSRKSWTGKNIHYEPFHPAWKIDDDHELTLACIRAYEKNFGTAPSKFDFWNFSTNAVTPISLEIPTIGFGPGDYKMAHMRDESCPINQITEASSFYIHLITEI